MLSPTRQTTTVSVPSSIQRNPSTRPRLIKIETIIPVLLAYCKEPAEGRNKDAPASLLERHHRRMGGNGLLLRLRTLQHLQTDHLPILLSNQHRTSLRGISPLDLIFPGDALALRPPGLGPQDQRPPSGSVLR